MCNHCEEHEEHEEHEHIEQGESRLIQRIVIASIIFIATYIFHFPTYINATLLVVAYLIAGGNVINRAVGNIIKGKIFDENFLMCIATIGALLIKEYHEAIMVMILYQLGEYLQDRAVEKSKKSISELMDIRPDYANIEKDGQLVKVSPSEVKTGEIITVRPGEKVPLDGIVTEGTATLDTSALTGESVPRQLKINDTAVSGCINTNGVIKIKVTKEWENSTVFQILELVEHASSKKAKTENFITRFAKIYTPLVVLAAVILAIVPPLVTDTSVSIWLNRALTFLVISCPCALVISVPLGFFAGIGGASKAGILIKGSCYLEALSKPELIAFDKTGTLTKGCFEVQAINSAENISQSELLEAAAIGEYYSNHPIASSIKKAYGKELSKDVIQNVKEIAGCGIEAETSIGKILVGNQKLMKQYNISYTPSDETGTIVYVAKNNQYIGSIIINDTLKPDTKEAIKEIHKLGISTVMLTGDNTQTADAVAKEINIDKHFANLLPADKVEKVETLIKEKNPNKSIIFVGDGINDAPVLTMADVGIAMGALGSDAAIEAADIVIMDDSVSKILTGIKISQKTIRIVKENIIFALGIKALFLILGTLGMMTMWGAVFADVGVALIAVLNSMRALAVKKR